VTRSLDDVVAKWSPLGRVDPAALRQARLEAHWAAQLPAAAARAWADPRPDDSHTSLVWNEARSLLVGQPLKNGLRVSLHVPELRLFHLDGEGEPLDGFSLAGATLREAFGWLAAMPGAPAGAELRVPDYDLPDHPVGAGGPFTAEPLAGLAELARWYGNAAALLAHVTEARRGASPLRCWPHHFDYATLLTLDPDEPDAEKARSIGIGLSPGDGSYEEPYFYVNPWPYPEARETPTLGGGGRWHLEGWYGAVLPAAALEPSTDGAAQAAQVDAFVRSALEAEQTMLRSG
jgi:hypothetical protein